MIVLQISSIQIANITFFTLIGQYSIFSDSVLLNLLLSCFMEYWANRSIIEIKNYQTSLFGTTLNLPMLEHNESSIFGILS